MSDPATPVLLYAETLTFDDDAGTLSAGLLAAEASENPSLAIDQIVAILWPSPSAQPVVVGLIEHTDDTESPYRLVAIQTPAKLPPQLASVPRVAQLPTHLARGGGGVVDYLLSTKAGTGRAVAFWEAVLQPLLRFAAQALSQDTEPNHVMVTDSDDSVREYARGDYAPSGDGPRTIVLLSGDGGVVDLLNSTAPGGEAKDESAPPPLPTIALIPLGTGNALFNSLHKPLFTGPSELVLALRTLLNGVAAPLPTFRASFPPGSRIVKYMNKDPTFSAGTPSEVAAAEAQLYRNETEVATLYGTIVASYGFHASIVYESDTPVYRAHGAARFGMVAQELLKESHPYAAEASIQRRGAASGELERIPRDVHAYILAALVSNLERTFTISPASKPLDGQLRLVHFAPLGPERTMEAMMKAYDGGKHVDAAWDGNDQRVHYDDVEELAIRVEDDEERWRKICIDGTIVDIPKGGTVHVRREEKSRFNIVVDSHVV